MILSFQQSVRFLWEFLHFFGDFIQVCNAGTGHFFPFDQCIYIPMYNKCTANTSSINEIYSLYTQYSSY